MAKGRLDWSKMPDASGRFEPRPFYDPDSDTLTVYLHDDESYRERVDRYLTVYRSIATKKVVGCHVKDVRKVLATVRAFKVGIETQHLTLAFLLMSVPWATAREQKPEEVYFRHYQEIVAPILEDAGDTALPVPEPVG